MNTGEVSTEADGSEMLQSILKQWLRWINIPGKEGRNGERYQLIRWIPVKLLPFFALLLATKDTQRTQWHIPEEWQEAIFPFFCRGILFFFGSGGSLKNSEESTIIRTHWAWPPGTLGLQEPPEAAEAGDVANQKWSGFAAFFAEIWRR